ncbi:MAG: hypothetical protein JSW26_19605 [Desulfobacterales bacterium]|nr:MAG: hypothetical protein JSW26_19605 [Desulfobacterales bacterium]
MYKKTPENKKGSETALKILDSLLKDSGRRKINENQIIVILDALANAEDIEVVARFPAVLAICARRGLVLNSSALFSRYWETSPKRQNLEKLLLVSAAIFKIKGITPPGNLKQIAASLRHKYGDLLSTGEFQLSSGMYVSIQALENKLNTYLTGGSQSRPVQGPITLKKSGSLDVSLDRLFSPKQKELVFKKRDGQAFTKTEREYYSRIVRKKLEAIASEELGELAKRLTAK